MKRLCLVIAFAMLITAALSSCSKQKPSDLKFYVIKRDELAETTTESEKIKAVDLYGRLAFDGDDIEGYNWQTHTVFLKSDSVLSLGTVTDESGGSRIFKTDDTYAFVLMLKNTIIYSGGFQNGIKNPDIPLQPSIEDSSAQSFKITFDSKYGGNVDPRSAQKLYDFLNKQGLLSTKTE